MRKAIAGKFYKMIGHKRNTQYAIAIIVTVISVLYGIGQNKQEPSTSPSYSNNKIIQPVNITIVDGDTFKTQNAKFRLWGIDAPELHQTCNNNGKTVKCGQAAKVALMSLILSKNLMCQIIDTDRYERKVVKCNIDEMDINSLMVQAGWALDYTHYSQGYYASVEEEAKSEKRGLWKMEFLKPWEWRHKNKSKF